MTAVISVAMLLVLRFGGMVDVVVTDASSRSVADAVALAGLIGDRTLAERIAAANGAQLVEFDVRRSLTQGDTVHVVVDLGGRIANAWATDAG